MHTTVLAIEEGEITVHHNQDFDGCVHLCFPNKVVDRLKPVDLLTANTDKDGSVTITIPGQLVRLLGQMQSNDIIKNKILAIFEEDDQ